MSVAWVAVGAAALGTFASSKASSKANQIAQESANVQQDAASRQLDAQVKQADELLTFNKMQYEEGKTRQVGIDAINKQVVQQNLDLSAKAGVRADESYDFYKTTGRPVIEKSLDDAKNFDSQGNIDAARGRASADVSQGFANAEQQQQRALTRMGVNPSSGRFLALQQSLQAEKAAALAGAGTNAETNVRGQAINMRGQASNIANGLPAQSLAQGAQSSGTGVAAAGVAAGGQQQNLAMSQAAMNGMAAGADIYGNAARGYSTQYGQSMNAANNAQQQANASQTGWGNLAGAVLSNANKFPNLFGSSSRPFVSTPGMGSNIAGGSPDGWWADGGALSDGTGGGKIRGPGTGTSDSVQAVNGDTGQRIHLSNGEYIIPADVVKQKGSEFFQKLIDKHHTPVNLGRKAS